MGSINFVYNADMVDAIVDIFKFEDVDEDLTEKFKEESKKRIREAKDIGENAIRNFLDEQPTMLIEIEMQTPQIILPLNTHDLQDSPCWIFYPGNLKVLGDTYSKNKDDPNYDIYSIELKDIQFVYCDTIKTVLNSQMTIEQLRTTTLAEFFYIFKDFSINIDIKILKAIFVNFNCIDSRFKINAKLNKLKLNLTFELLQNL